MRSLNNFFAFLISKKHITLLFLAIPFLLFSGYFYNNKAFNFRFVDEEDNFTIGKYLSKGDIIYEDIITNHQPLTYIFSAFIHDYTNINSVYELLIRHRHFEIIWSIGWSILLIFYFGLGAFIAVLIYEFTKIYLLGNLFLSESQIVYPLIFITGLIFFNQRRLKKLELIFIGICFGLAGFLLISLWPTLSFLLIVLMIKLYKRENNIFRSLGLVLLGFVLTLLAVFTFTSIPGYFYYTFYANLIYTIPNYHSGPWVITISKALSTPFLSFFTSSSSPTTIVIQILSVLMAVNVLFLIFRKQYFKVLSIFILLGLSNIRFVSPGSQGYEGFHLLPWYALFVFIESILSIEVLSKNNIILRVLNSLVIVLLVGLSINFGLKDLSQKEDMVKDYNINYSTAINRGDAVKAIKSSDDTLFVSPNAWLVYWQGDINHLSKLYGYYAWMASIPQVHSAILKAFSNKPPTFFYCEDCKGLDLEQFLTRYTEIKNHGNSSMLYVLNNRISTLTKKQLDQLNFYGFTIE